ncbi:hypothetical protein WJX74_002716 [Apatococcus lobatus]|uniref:Uncharacterized protein n=1 Tax=Apatococcus lobatus TaxID=904363 RepID=A0AAW1QI29_9CHLO
MEQHQSSYKAHFAAKIIQTYWRGYVAHTAFLTQKAAAQHIQGWWRRRWIGVRQRRLAALCIQRCWRAYCPRKIYHFFRDLVLFNEKQPPRELLKSINPQEATLFDGATGLHVRFRLGGQSFPPMLFYKIFTHHPISDICAYCPRDYAKDHPRPKRQARLPDASAWYCRMENNDWRPVVATMLPMLTETCQEQRQAKVHYAPIIRHQQLVKHRKMRKRQWLHKAYLRCTSSIDAEPRLGEQHA